MCVYMCVCVSAYLFLHSNSLLNFVSPPHPPPPPSIPPHAILSTFCCICNCVQRKRRLNPLAPPNPYPAAQIVHAFCQTFLAASCHAYRAFMLRVSKFSYYCCLVTLTADKKQRIRFQVAAAVKQTTCSEKKLCLA